MNTKPMQGHTVLMNGAQRGGGRIVLRTDGHMRSDAGVDYNVFASKLLGQGGQATAYLGKNTLTEEECVIKVNDLFAETPQDDANRTCTQAFLKKHTKNKTHYFLPLLDTGTIEYTVLDEKNQKKNYAKPVDVLPLCTELNRKKIPYDELKNTLIPAMATALNVMHKAGFIHRDVKPSNIYVYQKHYVLGDFGATVPLQREASVANAYYTNMRRGTVGYGAPEVRDGYAEPASDFYSLGITIATLYKGEYVHQNLLDSYAAGAVGEGAINQKIKDYGLPLGCPQAEQSIQTLVDALTRGDERSRPDYDDIMLWCSDREAFAKKYSTPSEKKETTATSPAFYYPFQDDIYHDLATLAAAFVKNPVNWEMARRDLYRGSVSGSILYAKVILFDMELARKIADVIEADETATDQDLGLAKVIHYMAPQLPLVWKGTCYQHLSDISAALEQQTLRQADALEMFRNGYITWRLEQTNLQDAAVMQAIEKVTRFIDEAPTIAVHLLRLQFATAPKSYRGATDTDSLFWAITKNSKQFYANLKAFLYDDKMLAFLSFLGWQEVVQSYLRHLTKDPAHDLQLFYRLYEKICRSPQKVREHYIAKGPDGDLYWLKCNLKRYQYRTEKTQHLKEQIVRVQLDGSKSIDTLAASMTVLRQYKKSFLEELQNDTVLACFQLGGTQKGIYTTDLDAFYQHEFLGKPVSTAFYRMMDME